MTSHTLPCKHQVRRYLLPIIFFMLVMSGCNMTKSVPEGDALFAGYSVRVKGEKDSSKRQAVLETELSATVRPEPNFSIFGWRPALGIYNAFYTEKEKGIKRWIMTKLGEPPVLFSELDTGSVSTIMSNRLHNRGYFNNTVGSTTTIENKKATVEWTARVGEPYRLRKIEYTLNDSLPVHRAIAKTKEGSRLQPGQPYDLQRMTQERVRIDSVLRNEGYYYFNPDVLIFSVDTTAGNRQADVLLRIKRAATPQALRPYTIDDIYIMATYNLGDSLATKDTIDVRGYHYIPNEDYVKARHLLKGVFIEKDSLYRRQNQLLTVRRTNGLPAYKFANLEFEQDTAQNDKLDAFLYLTPALKKSLRAEARMVNKSNNFAGPGVTVSFRNRNAFRGSELFTLEVTGSFESRTGGTGTGDAPEGVKQVGSGNLTSYELSAQATLAIPRIVSPFNLRNLRTEFVPQTRIGLGFSFLDRVDFFKMNSYNATYGYNWRPNQFWTFDATPINLQYVRVKSSPYFDSLLQARPFLQRSFENQFIIGSIYQATYSNQMLNQTHQFFDNITLDLSGNSLNAFQSLTGFPPPTDEEPRTIAGSRFSQYVLLDNDFRYYLNVGAESQLVARLVTGLGYSYGNSTTLPYVKQFSIGGPNSIRAFRARSVGPGTYEIPDTAAFAFFDQTGDIRLQTNLEYRFPIAGFFKGAVFVDAGNIWLLRDDPEREGGKFEANNILNQLAVGTGFGLRIDVEFFVIRLDLGIPVRVPYLPAGEKLVLRDFNGSFSGENSMVLNIAIGYPF